MDDMETIDDPDTLGKWALRFRLTLSHPLDSDEKSLSVELAGRRVKISAHKSVSLRTSQQIVILAKGFEAEEDARAFAQRLRFAILANAATRGIGADVGEDRATSQFAKFIIDEVEQAGRHFVPDVHGIHVYLRTAPELSMILSAEGTVLEPLDGFLSRLSDFVSTYSSPNTKSLAALEMVARAGVANEPLAKAAIYISAIELLAIKPWKATQKQLIKRLAAEALTADEIALTEAQEVSKAVENTFKFVKQGIRRLVIEELRLTEADWDDFSAVYDLRSRIFHGEVVSRWIYSELASRSAKVCAKIVLAAAGVNVQS